MGPHELVITTVKLQMPAQLLGRTIGGPSATGEDGNSVAQGEVEALNVSRLGQARKVQGLEPVTDLGQAAAQSAWESGQPAPPARPSSLPIRWASGTSA